MITAYNTKNCPPPKIVTYRNNKKVDREEFLNDEGISLWQILPSEYSALEAVFIEVLKKHAPLKVQVTQIFEIFYYLPNSLLFISNDRVESNILKNYISNGYFYSFKKSAVDASSISIKRARHTEKTGITYTGNRSGWHHQIVRIGFVLPLVATQIGNTSQLQCLTGEICLSYNRTCSTQGKQ